MIAPRAVPTALLVVLLLATTAVGASPNAPPTHASVAAGASPQTSVASLSVWTSLAGSGSVFLYLPDNSTGVMIYPTVHADMTSSANASYTVYVGGLEIASGSMVGTKEATFNVTGPTVSILIGFAGVTHQYRDEIVASTTVSTPPPPPPLLYTAQQFTQALLTGQIQVYAVLLLAFFGSFFLARKIVVLNAGSRAARIL